MRGFVFGRHGDTAAERPGVRGQRPAHGCGLWQEHSTAGLSRLCSGRRAQPRRTPPAGLGAPGRRPSSHRFIIVIMDGAGHLPATHITDQPTTLLSQPYPHPPSPTSPFLIIAWRLLSLPLLNFTKVPPSIITSGHDRGRADGWTGGRAGGRAGGYTCGESREELHKHAHRDDDEVDGWTGWAAGQGAISICPSLTQTSDLTTTVKPKWEGERGKGGEGS